MFAFLPVSYSLLVYLQVQQAVARAGGDLDRAESICAEDRLRLESVDDPPGPKARARSQNAIDEDA